jgi:hypothetical protein
VELKYSPEWPSVYDIDAAFVIDQDKFNLNINNATAKIPAIGVDLEKINGNIKFTKSSLMSENLRLTILGRSATALIAIDDHKPDVLRLSVKTPLQVAD